MGQAPVPIWPEREFIDIVEETFRDRIIATSDHEAHSLHWRGVAYDPVKCRRVWFYCRVRCRVCSLMQGNRMIRLLWACASMMGQTMCRCMTVPELLQWRELPFSIGAETLVVCYNAGAEAGFLHALGLGMPVCWLDLMAESRVMRNVCLRKGLVPAFEKRHPEILAPNRDISLLRTAALFGVDDGNADAKEDAGCHSQSEVEGSGTRPCGSRYESIASDVRLTARLFTKMEPHIDLQAALIRGRYAAEHGRMEQRGMPVDVETFIRLQREHGRILQRYQVDVDSSGDQLTVKGRVRQTWLANKIRELGAEQFHQQTPKGQWSTRAVHLGETAVRFEDAELLQWRSGLTCSGCFRKARMEPCAYLPLAMMAVYATTSLRLQRIPEGLWG